MPPCSAAHCSAFSRVRLKTVSSWPARRRFAAWREPMMPSPMKPTSTAAPPPRRCGPRHSAPLGRGGYPDAAPSDARAATLRRRAERPRSRPGAGGAGSSRCAGAASAGTASRGASWRGTRGGCPRCRSRPARAPRTTRGRAQVAVDDAVDAQLRVHREVDADVVEQRLGRSCEVVAVRGQAMDGRLAGAQDSLMVGRAITVRSILDDGIGQLPVDGAAEVVHGRSPWVVPTAPGDSSPTQLFDQSRSFQNAVFINDGVKA